MKIVPLFPLLKLTILEDVMFALTMRQIVFFTRQGFFSDSRYHSCHCYYINMTSTNAKHFTYFFLLLYKIMAGTKNRIGRATIALLRSDRCVFEGVSSILPKLIIRQAEGHVVKA